MILLDTPTIIFDALDRSKLSQKASDKIRQADQASELLISDISIWEISNLIKNGHIVVDESPANFIQLYLDYRHLEVIPIRGEIAELAVSFDEKEIYDPFDKIIAATSIVLAATIITPDTKLIKNSMLHTLW